MKALLEQIELLEQEVVNPSSAVTPEGQLTIMSNLLQAKAMVIIASMIGQLLASPEENKPEAKPEKKTNSKKD